MDKQLSMPDLLSDLPLGIIHIILSFLPIRGAIRTSILSREWRYVWASLPHLAFDDKCLSSPSIHSSMTNPYGKCGIYRLIKKRLIHFISQTLFLHQGPIRMFELRLPFLSSGDRRCIDKWLIFLSRNDVRNLLIIVDSIPFGYKFFSSLYSCQNLTHLKLHVNEIPPPPPSFKGFLCLRSLDIRLSIEYYGTIESIVALSPLLEKFTLGCSEVKDFTIRAPNLKYFHFHFRSMCDHLSLCTPLLEEFVGVFSPAKSFSIGAESLVFHHLKTIKLFYVNFHVKEVIIDVIRLITGSPHLQKLEISSCPSRQTWDSSFWDIESMPDFTYDSLKVIKMGNFNGEIDEMKLIKFLLERSSVLEKMVIKPSQFLPDLMLLKSMAQLLTYRRASTNAEIVIEDHAVSSSLQL